MNPIHIAVIIIASIASSIALLGVWLSKKRKELGIVRKTDYRVFFTTGAVLMLLGAVGITYMFFSDIPYIAVFPLLLIGTIYITIGLNNKEMWVNSK
jgi:phosphatidylglycerophosphate synthase